MLTSAQASSPGGRRLAGGVAFCRSFTSYHLMCPLESEISRRVSIPSGSPYPTSSSAQAVPFGPANSDMASGACRKR